jgi:hypothetical protein
MRVMCAANVQTCAHVQPYSLLTTLICQVYGTNHSTLHVAAATISNDMIEKLVQQSKIPIGEHNSNKSTLISIEPNQQLLTVEHYLIQEP